MKFIFMLAYFCGLIYCIDGDTCLNLVRLQATTETQYFLSHSSYGTASYENNQHTCWIIQADEDQRVEVDADEVNLNGGCNSQSGDKVNIYNGDSDEGDLLETICEDRDSYKTDSTGRYLYVEFITDSQGGDEGFKMSYTIAEEAPTHEGEDRGSDAGFIAAIVVGSLFGLAIIVGFTACVITCIVIAWNEKNTARVQGVVHRTADGNIPVQEASSSSPQDQAPQFFTGNRDTRAGGGSIFSTAQSATGGEIKTMPKSSEVVEVDAAHFPPEYTP